MSIYDRNYMREEEDPADWWKPGYSIKRWLTIGIVAVSLLTSVVWLVRSTGLGRSHRTESHRKQSLVVNINSATEKELDTLPGIGPVRAGSIIAGRPYNTVDDLKRVSGLGGKQFELMRPFVKVDGKNEPVRPR